MKPQPCKVCKRRFNTLTPEKICYYCHINKYKTPPTQGIYKIEVKK